MIIKNKSRPWIGFAFLYKVNLNLLKIHSRENKHKNCYNLEVMFEFNTEIFFANMLFL